MSPERAARGERRGGHLADLVTLLEPAQAGGYAVGAFLFCSAEAARAMVQKGVALRSPVLLITGPWETSLLGLDMLVETMDALASRADVPMCLHYDHASEPEEARACLDAGFPSVMIDASRHEFEENVRQTRSIVEAARETGATVEGELGGIGRVGDVTPEGSAGLALTEPDRAAEFVRRTGVDALAVSIGNAHGVYKQRPELDFSLLEAIRQATSVALVLHGGSGTPPDQLRRAIEIGVSKVNVATELSQAYVGAIQQAIEAKGSEIWYAQALEQATSAVAGVVEKWMRQLGSAGRIA